MLRIKLTCFFFLFGTWNNVNVPQNFSVKSNVFSIKLDIFIYSRFCCFLATGQSNPFIKEIGISLLAEIRALSVILCGLFSHELGAQGEKEKKREYMTVKNKFITTYTSQRRNN